jgi:MtfA peptidase
MFLFTGMRRRRLRSRPFPPDWLRTLEQRVPFFPLLPPADREELTGHIRVFLDEKSVEGGGGFRVTDEVRLVIAAHACLLLLHQDADYFPGLSSIVVYPDEFVAPLAEVDEAGIVTEGEDLRSGESWQQGTLVLSWEDVLLGGQDGYEDYNVIFHEFAHQLDARHGITSGAALPGSGERFWEAVLEAEYLRLKKGAEQGEATFLDPYGAESPEEFFAVAVESFFTIPVEFRDELPELYAGLSACFRQDPANWSAVSG